MRKAFLWYGIFMCWTLHIDNLIASINWAISKSVIICLIRSFLWLMGLYTGYSKRLIKISERLEKFKPESCGVETSWDLALRYPFAWGIEAKGHCKPAHYSMMSPNGNIFRVSGPLCGEFTGHRWIPRTEAIDASFDVFFYLHLNKGLSKQSLGWWFKTLSRSLLRQHIALLTSSLIDIAGDYIMHQHFNLHDSKCQDYILKLIKSLVQCIYISGFWN